jgi:hypothetical protein
MTALFVCRQDFLEQLDLGFPKYNLDVIGDPWCPDCDFEGAEKIL